MNAKFSDTVLAKIKGTPKVLVCHPDVHKDAIDLLKHKCEVIHLRSDPIIREEILENCQGMDGFLWAGHEKLDAEVLDAAGQNLRSISTMSSGYDFVDLNEIIKRQIPFGNTPDVLRVAVAEMAIGLMVAASRRFQEGRTAIENDAWNSTSLNWMLGHEIRDAKVGFLGFGNIGQAIADRLIGFEINSIIYHTRHVAPNAEKYNARHVSFDDLLQQSNIIFIICPLTTETKEKFDDKAFSKMKSNAVLINVARGKIIDQKALFNALDSNKIFAAGLDVTDPEPLPKDDPLLTLPNCVITPHLGSATTRTRREMAIVAAQNVLLGLAGDRMISPIYQP